MRSFLTFIESKLFTHLATQYLTDDGLHEIQNQYFQIPRTISRESFRPSTLAPAGILRCAMLTPDAQRIFKNYDASNGWERT